METKAQVWIVATFFNGKMKWALYVIVNGLPFEWNVDLGKMQVKRCYYSYFLVMDAAHNNFDSEMKTNRADPFSLRPEG